MNNLIVYSVEILDLGVEVHRVLTIDHSLESMQSLVGGHLECIVPEGLPKGIDMWINEEGRLIPLPPSYTPFFYETIFGSYFLARHDGQGETISLTKEDLKAIVERARIVKG